MRTLLAGLMVLAGVTAGAQVDGWYKVKDLGAKADGETADTAAVQKAIDTCAADGGGTVFFGPGIYLCGSIHLKNNVTLWLDRAAVIKASPKKEDFDPYETLGFKNDADRETSFFHFSLIWGEDVEGVGILGDGTVDCNRDHRGGPKTIALKRCKHVDIKGIRVINNPNYPISLLGCEYVNIDGVTIQNGFADGIDPDSCRNVRISNCQIECYDDPIVPKASFSLGERRPCENITVTNCILSTNCNALKLGTESGGDFKRIAFTNCVIMGRNGQPATGGIALESVDGSNIDGIVASNITMVNVRVPIFLRLGNRGRDMDKKVPGSLRNVCIENIVATDASFASSITGIPGHAVEGVTLSNIRIVYQGANMQLAPGTAVPELEDKYPEPDMFGMLPGYGFYCRHVRDLSLSHSRFGYKDDFWRLTEAKDSDVNWRTTTGIPEQSQKDIPGMATYFEDVTGLVIEDLGAQVSSDGAPLMQFVDVQKALVHGCLAPDAPVFLTVSGEKTGEITLANNAVSGPNAIVKGKDVPGGAVK